MTETTPNDGYTWLDGLILALVLIWLIACLVLAVIVKAVTA